VLVLPDDVPAHPYDVAMETAMLAPNAEVSLFSVERAERAHSARRAPDPLIPPRAPAGVGLMDFAKGSTHPAALGQQVVNFGVLRHIAADEFAFDRELAPLRPHRVERGAGEFGADALAAELRRQPRYEPA